LKTNSNFESLQIDEDEQIFEIFFLLNERFHCSFQNSTTYCHSTEI